MSTPEPTTALASVGLSAAPKLLGYFWESRAARDARIEAFLLAELVCCSEKTVRRALAWLKVMGFLTWKRRLRAKPHASGSRQASNAYLLVERLRLAFVGTQLFQRLSGHRFRPSSDDRETTPANPQPEPLFAA